MQRCWGYFKFRRLRGGTTTYFLHWKMRKRICGFLDSDFRLSPTTRNITHFDAALSGLIIIIFRKKKKKCSCTKNQFIWAQEDRMSVHCLSSCLIIISHLSAAASPLWLKIITELLLLLLSKPLSSQIFATPLYYHRQCSKIRKRVQFWEVAQFTS